MLSVGNRHKETDRSEETRSKMTGNDIYTAIRRTSLRHMLLPVLSVAALVFLYSLIPFDDVFSPIEAHTSSEADSLYRRGHEYIYMHADVLYYTGFDIMEGDSIQASYYYEITDNKCTFYILENEQTNNRALELKNVDIRVRLDERDGLLDNVISSFSASLGWTAEGMSSITAPIVINQAGYGMMRYVIVYVFIILNVIYSVALVTVNLMFVIFPQTHVSRIRYYALHPFGMKKALGEMKRDFEENVVLSAGDMYLSGKYFYNLGKNEVSIMPLDNIVLGYEYSRLHSVFGKHLKITHTLCLRGTHIRKCNASGKSAADVAAVKHYLRKAYPDILWGHTKENARLIKERLKSEKAKQRSIKKEQKKD